MKRDLIDKLNCPTCGRSLELNIEETDEAGEIITGTLFCGKCNTLYLIEDGEPIFFPEQIPSQLKRGGILSRLLHRKKVKVDISIHTVRHSIYTVPSFHTAMKRVNYSISVTNKGCDLDNGFIIYWKWRGKDARDEWESLTVSKHLLKNKTCFVIGGSTLSRQNSRGYYLEVVVFENSYDVIQECMSIEEGELPKKGIIGKAKHVM